jgi:iron(III) transport system ATP-binding protein
VVDEVSFCVGAGEVVCLLGASGSGKSTTLRIGAGIERADRGEIVIAGVIADGPGVFIAPEKRQVGLVFQDLALFPHLDATRNAAFGLYRLPKAEAARRAADMLAVVGLSHLAHAFPHQLSGGEQQRLAVARALATRPAAMLLDEPFSGLDDRLRDGVRSEVLSILRGQGAATLFVTHDPDEALRSADRIVLLREGRVIQDGTPADLFDAPADLGVAEFFSPINRMAGIVAGGAVLTPFGPVPVPGALTGHVTVALRPRDLAIVASGGVSLTAAEIRPSSEGCHARFAPHPVAPEGLVCVFDGHPPLRPGDEVRVGLKPGRGFVFPAGDT